MLSTYNIPTATHSRSRPTFNPLYQLLQETVIYEAVVSLCYLKTSTGICTKGYVFGNEHLLVLSLTATFVNNKTVIFNNQLVNAQNL